MPSDNNIKTCLSTPIILTYLQHLGLCEPNWKVIWRFDTTLLPITRVSSTVESRGTGDDELGGIPALRPEARGVQLFTSSSLDKSLFTDLIQEYTCILISCSFVILWFIFCHLLIYFPKEFCIYLYFHDVIVIYLKALCFYSCRKEMVNIIITIIIIFTTIITINTF